ncbi:hypothetical protein CP03DC29_0343B, partial [Chlamydia psittaci 03DC29]
ATSDAGSFSN